MHNKIQSKIPYERSQNLLHDEEGRSLVAYPKTQNMTESLDLIQFKCYQDILKQKHDNRARDMPLSYSKSIQYLGQETGMFMKFREPSGPLDEKYSTAKLSQNPFKETKNVFESTSKSSDGQIAVLKDKDYWSPVNIRVQKLIQRAQQRDDATKSHQIFHTKTQSQQSFFPAVGSQNESGDQIKENYQGNQDSNQNVANNEEQNILVSDQKSSTLSLPNNNSPFASTFLSKKISANKSHSPDSMLFLKEQYALKSMEKSTLGTTINKAEEQLHQKQFAPLKLCPPFIRHSYGSKSPLFQMGLLRNERAVEFRQRPGVIHANNHLRASWQNRVGNSTAKSSVHEEQTYFPLSQSKSSTNGFGLSHSSRFSMNFMQNQEKSNKNINQESELDINEHKNKVEQLLDYVNLEQENNNIQQNLVQSSNKRHKECNEIHSTMQLTSTLSQLRQEGFNHFFNSDMLKNDQDHIRQDKTNSQLNNKKPFKQSNSLSAAEILIQNQLPGSKLTSKRVRQQNYSALNFSQEDSNKKVYFTLPDRGNFFKNKSIGFAGQILRRD